LIRSVVFEECQKNSGHEDDLVDMEKIFNALEEWGCDVKGALERFLDDKDLYMTCLETVITDSNFEKLGVALEEENVLEAFDYSHTLKGVFANLGLTPMFSIVETIVEPLRGGSAYNLGDAYQKLLASNEQLKSILGK